MVPDLLELRELQVLRETQLAVDLPPTTSKDSDMTNEDQVIDLTIDQKIFLIEERIDLLDNLIAANNEVRNSFIANGQDISNPEEYDMFIQGVTSAKNVLVEEKNSLANQG